MSKQGRESFNRMNYLYQAGKTIAPVNPILSAYYGKLCQSIGKKSVLRIEPEIKRQICKTCGLVLLPGTSAELSVNRDKICEIRCKQCGTLKRFIISEDYNSWLDNSESVVESISI